MSLCCWRLIVIRLIGGVRWGWELGLEVDVEGGKERMEWSG